MERAHEVFISYAHIDNEPLIDDEDGWIDTLHRALEKRLAMLLGRRPSIWRDPKLHGNDVFSDVISSELLNTEILVSVLSPRYVKSEWCLKEFTAFVEASEEVGGVHIATKSRVFKVLKTPVERWKHPAEVRDLLGYEFYRIDPQTQRSREFDKAFGGDRRRNFWDKLEDLAQDICTLLEAMRSSRSDGGHALTQESGVNVFLAETSLDLRTERDVIKRDLEARGYTVLPAQPLPLNGPDLEALVREDIRRCALSVHLIGEHYGIVPESAQESMNELQYSVVAEHMPSRGFARLVWLPSNLEFEDERQREFVNSLMNDPTAQMAADVLQTSVEDLKTIIQRKLSSLESEPVAEIVQQDEHSTRIYLVFDQRDEEVIEPIEDYLNEKDFEVITPIFEGDESEIRQYHQDTMEICDAVLIYYGQASDAWLKVRLSELRKVFGYGRERPMLATSILIGGPESRRKDRFHSTEVDEILRPISGLAPDELKPFLNLIEQRRDGPAK